MDNANRLQILKENYEQVEQTLSFKEWVKVESENDPAFFYWFFGSSADNISDFGSGMTPEQQSEWDTFFRSIEN